jgi:hypothetical protein
MDVLQEFRITKMFALERHARNRLRGHRVLSHDGGAFNDRDRSGDPLRR